MTSKGYAIGPSVQELALELHVLTTRRLGEDEAMAENAPNIYQYCDFRHYLHDLLQFKKNAENPKYSYRKFATLCGFESEAGIRLLMSGRRSLTKPRLLHMANTLPLSEAEKEYFLDLVRWNQADNIQDTVRYFDRLSRHLMRHYVTDLSGDYAELLLMKWYYIVVREMALLENFKPDPEWISHRLADMISPEEAQEALDLLLRAEFLKKEGDRFVAIDKNVTLESGIAQRMLDMLHVQTICTSLKAMKDLTPVDREIHSLTISLDQDNFDKLRRYLRDCIAAFMTEANRVTLPKHVYQCNLQFFKLTRDE